MRHVDEGDSIQYVVRWNGYKPTENTAQTFEHILKHFIICIWSQMEKNESVSGQCGRTHVKGRGNVPKWLTLADNKNVTDEILNNGK